MAAQTGFSVEMFPVSVPLMEDAQSDALPAPQLVMLANVAAVTAADNGGGGDGDEKEMMELKTVGSSYSDSEEENIVRYSYDSQSYREVCILEYPESPSPSIVAVVVGTGVAEGDGVKAEDLSRHTKPRPSADTKTPEQAAETAAEQAAEQAAERRRAPVATPESAKKKKPFHCKPCRFQAQNERQFVEHLGTHGVSKMMVVNRVEGRSRTRTKDSPEGSPEARAPPDEGADSGEDAAAGEGKGLIRCERCGYNTNRYDHYIAHLKHHSKEGEDHRVFKCTLCPYTTVSQYHWRKHLRNHFPSKLHTCSQCSYFSDRKSNYIQHIRTHTGVRPFQCPYCDYSSSQKTHLTRHMRTHSGERPFKCESCNYLAANQHEVTRHARQVHNGPKPLSCPYCEYKTADRSNFKKHVELHLNPRQFLCPLCKYAASKKCNLQYHIKSRHSGCDVSVDISKVKLRVKKPGAEENQDSGESKFDNSSSMEEDFDMDDEDEDSSPINLSITKSSRPGVAQPVQTEAPDKPQKKSNVAAEKVQKVKEKVEPEKKVSTRQKKTEKVNEKVNETPPGTETITAAVNADKAKRRAKKLPAEKTTGQNQTAGTKPDRADQQRSEKEVRQKEGEKLRPEKERGHQKIESSGKENKTNKPRKSGSKKSERRPEHVEEAPQKPEIPEKKEKVVKEKTAKRKAAEALDLSQKSSPETPSKTRRLKEKQKPAAEETKEVHEATPAAPRSTGSTPAKQKKTRNTGRKATSLPQTEGPIEDQKTSVDGPEASAEPELPAQKTTSTDGTTPTLPEKTLDKPACSPAEDRPAPTFAKPTSPPALVLPGQRNKAGDPEDDEGVHSSHEGGSDISDSASEGSDDSGLNGNNGAGSGKMANDPETPTDEIPTPTGLKSHLCIFCDRTFPLEAEYRRHLNRHLVNVYYMGDTAKAPK
ncbi:RE1-silencing transcription factor [Clinocottus analis]|uniref:RE1-silencing transcription factor n=1 Tax=Clinocottus analis TaxID=304258 RepID=UPI0035C15223